MAKGQREEFRLAGQPPTVADPSTIALVSAPINTVWGPVEEEVKQAVQGAPIVSLPETPAVLPVHLLLEALTALGNSLTQQGQALQQISARLDSVEALAARQSVPAPAPPAPPAAEPASTQDDLRETMWNRTAQRLQHQDPGSFLPEEPPVVVPLATECARCKTGTPYRPSRYCLVCLQAMNVNRCPRCGELLPADANCRVCSEEARIIEQIRPGARLPVGEYSQEVVELVGDFGA